MKIIVKKAKVQFTILNRKTLKSKTFTIMFDSDIENMDDFKYKIKHSIQKEFGVEDLNLR